MVSVVKFSEFPSGGDLTSGDTTVGLLGGLNTSFTNPWTFLAPGSTASRPVPSSAIYYRLRLNTDSGTYEYYDTLSSMWTELSGSGTGTVNPGVANDLAFYAANGTAISPITAAAHAVLVTNGSDIPSLSTTLPSGLTIPGATITGSTAALTAGSVVAAPVAGSDLVNKTYADNLFAGAVDSITGTTNQIIASSPTGNVTLSLPQDIALGSTPTFGGLTLSSIPLNLSSGGTNASLTASNGGIVYSTASKLAILAGTATANLPLLSQSNTAPIWGPYALSLGGALTTAGALTTSGAYGVTFTFTGTTGVTFPTSGTLATTSGANVSSVSGTSGQIVATPTTGAVVVSIDPAYVGQTSLTTLGTITTGTWNATNIALGHGGTNAALTASNGGIVYSTASAMAILSGIATANLPLLSGSTAAPTWGSYAISLGGALTTGGAFTLSGAYGATFTFTNTTAVTFPTSGTLATTSQLPAGAALTRTNDTNVTLTLGGTPATALLQATSLALGWTGDLAINRGGTGVGSVTTAPTASAWAGWDANSNLSANNHISGYATTVSSATPIVLTVASAYQQFITGTTAQTVTMPVTSTLATISSGTTQSFLIVNISTNTTTINSSGGNLIESLPANSGAIITCISNSGTTAASWSSDFIQNTAGVASITGTANQVIASASTGAVTLSTPQSIGTGSSPTFAALTLTNPYIAGAGGIHSRQIFTSGSSATYTKPSNVTSILVEVLGGGGAGGGAAFGTSTAAAGAGGGGGGYAQLFIASAASTYTYTVGGGGTAGSVGNNPGNSGGTTSFGASLQATGGAGGTGSAAIVNTSANRVAPGAGGVGTNGDINCNGQPGIYGLTLTGGIAAGNGGSSIFGGGGAGVLAAGTGNAGLNYGAGGSGAGATATTSYAGGVGSGGLIIVTEYC